MVMHSLSVIKHVFIDQTMTNDRTVKFNPHFVQITWVILGIYSDKRIKPILNNSHQCVFSIPFTLVNANYKHLPNVVKSKTSQTFIPTVHVLGPHLFHDNHPKLWIHIICKYKMWIISYYKHLPYVYLT